jgi:hypothetical protein
VVPMSMPTMYLATNENLLFKPNSGRADVDRTL